MILLHGTSTVVLDAILKRGIKEPVYLTQDERMAHYFAEDAASENGGKPIVLWIEVDEDQLRPDAVMYQEPLSIVWENLQLKSEDEWHRKIESNEIPWPGPTDWETSLEYALSVRHKGRVKPDQIRQVERIEE